MKFPTNNVLSAFALFILSFGLRAAYVAASETVPGLRTLTPGLDGQIYWDAARNWRQGVSPNIELMACSAPLHVWWLALLQIICGESFYAAKMVTAALASCRYVMMFLISKQLRIGTISASAAIGALILTPAMTYFDTALLKISNDLNILCVLIFATLCYRQAAAPRGRILSAAAAGSALVLSALNQQSTVFYVVPVTLVLWQTTNLNRRRWIAPVAVTATVLSFVAWFYTGQGNSVRPTPLAGINFYLGFNPAAAVGYKKIDGIPPYPYGHALEARVYAENQRGIPTNFSEANAFFAREAWRWIAEEPRRAANLAGRRLWAALGNFELKAEDYLPWMTTQSFLLRNLPFSFGGIVTLGLSGLLFIPDRRARSFLAGLICVILFMCTATFLTFRFRAPLYIPLTFGVAAILERATAFARGVGLASARDKRSALLVSVGISTTSFFTFARLDKQADYDARAMDQARINAEDSAAAEQLTAKLRSAEGLERAQILARLHRYSESFQIFAAVAPEAPEYKQYVRWVGQGASD